MRALLTLIALVPLACSAADRLSGTWRSDHDASVRFAKDHTILETRLFEFLDGSLGRLVLTFDGTTMRSHIPDFDINIDGKLRHFAATHQSSSYRVLGIDQDSVALLAANYFGRERILHIHFVSDDEFWLYSEESDYGLRDLNFREYFRRAK
jgi:hypothetical protein